MIKVESSTGHRKMSPPETKSPSEIRNLNQISQVTVRTVSISSEKLNAFLTYLINLKFSVGA